MREKKQYERVKFIHKKIYEKLVLKYVKINTGKYLHKKLIK